MEGDVLCKPRHIKFNERLPRMQWEEVHVESKLNLRSSKLPRISFNEMLHIHARPSVRLEPKHRQMQASRGEKHHAMHDDDTAPNEQQGRTGSCKPSSFECREAVASLIQGCKESRAGPSPAQASFARWVCYHAESSSAIASRFAMQRSMQNLRGLGAK